jgi:galactokinase/mevalonate kinase-like predicted kinase/carbonic anhydrase/acetyltransferase-like protein (isoleucine patch superfamily)
MGESVKKQWDYIVLTVGCSSQGLLCERLLTPVEKKYSRRLLIVSDDESGQRIGSGGAVLNTLQRISLLEPNCDISKLKILLINSGGMSKRNINFALCTKALANVDLDCSGNAVTAFEKILQSADAILEKIDSGMLISCSDILVDASGADFDNSNNFGFFVKADLTTASRHGVAFSDKCGEIDRYFHKSDEKKLRELSSEYLLGDCAYIDTGLIYFCSDFVSELLGLIGKDKLLQIVMQDKTEINLYPDIVYLLAKKIDYNDYLSDISDGENCNEKIKNLLYKRLSGFTAKVVLADAPFVHFGTLRETLINIKKLTGAQSYINFSSVISKNAEVGVDSVIDNALIGADCAIGKNCFISDISLENAAVPDNTAVCGIKLSDGRYAAIVCDVEENPKKIVNGISLWDTERFCAANSFSESYSKFISGDFSGMLSMDYCVKNADYSYFLAWRQYILEMKNTYLECPDYQKYSKKISDEYFSEFARLKKIKCIKNCAEIKLPVRLNFSGTWTDASPYCVEHSGRVVNASALVDGEMPISVSACRIPEKQIELCNVDTNEKIVLSCANDIQSVDDFGNFGLHKVALLALGIDNEVSFQDGFRLSTKVSGISKGSGLGVSSILLAGCFKVLGELFGADFSNREIIEMVFAAEQLMKTGGGWQDQAGGLIYGIKDNNSLPGLIQNVSTEIIDVSDKFVALLSKRTALVYTGQRHYGRFIVNDVMRRYLDKESDTLQVFEKLNELNDMFVSALRGEDIDGLSDCINEQWRLLKKLSPLVTNNEINAVVNDCKKIADAVCICGAGGGGYLMVIMKDGVDIEDIKNTTGKEVKKIDILL